MLVLPGFGLVFFRAAPREGRNVPGAFVLPHIELFPFSDVRMGQTGNLPGTHILLLFHFSVRSVFKTESIPVSVNLLAVVVWDIGGVRCHDI